MALLPLGIWAASGAGGGGASDFQLISTQLVSSSVASVTFSSIPSTFRHLQLRVAGRGEQSAASISIRLTANSDSGANYASHYIFGDGSSVYSVGLPSETYASLGFIPAAQMASSVFGASIIDVLDYSKTTKNKTFRALNGFKDNTFPTNRVALHSALWASTSAINSLSLVAQSGNWAVGSRFSLYGWN